MILYKAHSPKLVVFSMYSKVLSAYSPDTPKTLTLYTTAYSPNSENMKKEVRIRQIEVLSFNNAI